MYQLGSADTYLGKHDRIDLSEFKKAVSLQQEEPVDLAAEAQQIPLARAN